MYGFLEIRKIVLVAFPWGKKKRETLLYIVAVWVMTSNNLVPNFAKETAPFFLRVREIVPPTL